MITQEAYRRNMITAITAFKKKIDYHTLQGNTIKKEIAKLLGKLEDNARAVAYYYNALNEAEINAVDVIDNKDTAVLSEEK